MKDEDILNGLDWEVEEPDVVDVTNLTMIALGELFSRTKQELLDIGEVLKPITQQGRDLHSVYGACIIEFNKRGVL